MIPRLWYITDRRRGSGGRALHDVIERAVDGGVRGVILREPSMPDGDLLRLIERLQPLRQRGAVLLASRRLDLANTSGLDGVHLARDAISVQKARRWLGATRLIGYSAHAPDEARSAAHAGADYVTLSPIYPTGSKPGAPARGIEWLRCATAQVPIPVLGLGGVTAGRAGEILGAGAWGVAAVSAIGAASDVTRAARAFSQSTSEIHT